MDVRHILKKETIFKKSNILAYIVLILSLLNIQLKQNHFFSLSVLISIIGILGFFSYIIKNNFYKPFFLLWIIAQVPIIEIIDFTDGIKNVTSIVDMSQSLRIKIGFGLTYIPKTYYIGINLIPILYYAFYKFLMNKSVVSNEITILPVTELSPIAKFTPMKAKIINISENGSLIAELKEGIEIENVNFKTIVFNTVDKSIFRLKKIRQKCYIKLTSENNQIEIDTEGFIN